MFSGSLVALVTPMREDGAVDYSALQRLIDFHVEQGSDAIVAVGTTGESATLTPVEHCEVVKRSIEYAAGRIPVIAGTGANSTAEAVEFTSEAHANGADACLLVVPYYNKPTQEGLYRHFRHIAEAVPVPQILYNVPGRTSLDMTNDTVVRLSEIPNIIGIKDATADIPRARDLVERCGKGFLVISGDDGTTLELILAGGKGCISVTANVAPRLMHEMCATALSGDRIGAEAINDKLASLHEALFLESSPIPVKWAVQQMGLMEGGIRLPLTPLDASYHEALRAAMQEAGAL